MRTRRSWVLGGALLAAFAFLRVAPFVGSHVGVGVDSFDYETSSLAPLLSRAFLGGARPLGYPLVLKLLRHDRGAVTVVQAVLGVAAWSLLALMAARATRHPALRVTAAVVVLAMGVSFDVAQWDRVLATESLSISAVVALLAAALWLRERWTAPRVAAVLALALGAALLRDSNGSFFAVVAVVLAVGVIARRLPRRMLVVVSGLLIVAALTSWSASSGLRWEGPLKDVVTMRLLPTRSGTAFLYDHGMPLSRHDLVAVRGRCVSPHPTFACVPLSDPAFYRWVREHGRSVYAAYLVQHPVSTIVEPGQHFGWSLGSTLHTEVLTHEHPGIGRAVGAIVFVRGWLPAVLGGVLLLVVSAVASRRGSRGPFVLAALLVALVYPHLWLVWIGGALEVTRHSLLASIQLRLGVWLGAIWLLDAAFATRAGSAREPASRDLPEGDRETPVGVASA